MGVLQITENDDLLAKVSDYGEVDVVIDLAERITIDGAWWSDIYERLKFWIGHQLVADTLESTLYRCAVVIAGQLTKVKEVTAAPKRYNLSAMEWSDGPLISLRLENGFAVVIIKITKK